MDRRLFRKLSGHGAAGVTLSQVLAACAARDLEEEEQSLGSSEAALRAPGGDYGPLSRPAPSSCFPRDSATFSLVKQVPIGASEFAGPTWSPDGQWLFVNLQYPGVTAAITGPWHRGSL